jgi:hypothetical protein
LALEPSPPDVALQTNQWREIISGCSESNHLRMFWIWTGQIFNLKLKELPILSADRVSSRLSVPAIASVRLFSYPPWSWPPRWRPERRWRCPCRPRPAEPGRRRRRPRLGLARPGKRPGRPLSERLGTVERFSSSIWRETGNLTWARSRTMSSLVSSVP